MSVDHKNGEDSVDPPSTIAGLWVLILFILTLAIAAIYFLPEWIVVRRYEAGPILETEIASKVDTYRRTAVLAMGGVVMIVGLYITLRPIRPADRQAHERVEAGTNFELSSSSMSIRDLPKWVWSRWWGLGSAYQLGLGVLLIVALALVAFAAYGIFWWPRGVPDIENLTEFQQQQLAGDRRLFAIQLAGALVVFIGLYLTFRRIKASERQVQAVEDGQVTERFSRAIEHLGTKNLAVRLGGIYALERIAKDSPDDHWTVMETLSAFVRENANSVLRREDFKKSLCTRSDVDVPRPETAVLEALKVLGRRRKEQDPTGSRLDLRGAKLAGLRLEDSDLSRANFSNAHLPLAHFLRCDLNNTRFVEAELWGSSFVRLDSLYKADFSRGELPKAEIVRCDARQANFSFTQFEMGKLRNSDLRSTRWNITERWDQPKIQLQSCEIDDVALSQYNHISPENEDSRRRKFPEDLWTDV